MSKLKKYLRAEHFPQKCGICGIDNLSASHRTSGEHRRTYLNMKKEKQTSEEYKNNYEDLFWRKRNKKLADIYQANM